MSSRFMWVAALATVSALAWQSAAAQASGPVTREQRKAETAAANKAGQLTPAGQGGAHYHRVVNWSSPVRRAPYSHSSEQYA